LYDFRAFLADFRLSEVTFILIVLILKIN